MKQRGEVCVVNKKEFVQLVGEYLRAETFVQIAGQIESKRKGFLKILVECPLALNRERGNTKSGVRKKERGIRGRLFPGRNFAPVRFFYRKFMLYYLYLITHNS